MDTNQQGNDDNSENGGGILDDSNGVAVEDSDDEDEELSNLSCNYTYTPLNEKSFEKLKQNDPSVFSLRITLSCDRDEPFFKSVDWKVDGDCIANNKHLKRLFIIYNGRPWKKLYILGEEGEHLPTRQQLQGFFSCIYRNQSIKDLSIRSIQIVGEFAGDLIEGLCGHLSIKRLNIGYGATMGSIGCRAVGKVMAHPKSKVKHLLLISNKISDEGVRCLSDALLGNSQLKKLFLSGNKKISTAGWRVLSSVLQHPNCSLTEISLSQDCMNNDESASILGAALRGTSVKVLDLSYNKSISSTGWQTLFNHLSQSSIVQMDLNDNKITDGDLVVLCNIGLKSLDLYNNKLITPIGWRSFFNTLQTRGNQLVEINISLNWVGDEGINALGSSLSSMSSLKSLDMHNMSYSADHSNNITSQGWVAFFNALQDSKLDLVELNLNSNAIDDEGIQLLVRAVSNMSSLKNLKLEGNHSVSFAGWQSLTGYLQSPNNFALEELHVDNNNLNDVLLVSFTSALVGNKNLRHFSLSETYDDDGEPNGLITERGWEAASTLLCNKKSIMDTYTSNHTLQNLSDDFPDELNDTLWSYLELNENNDKEEVARQKILQTHFSTNETSKMQELLDMELKMMPTVIEWIGRPAYIGWRGTNVSGLSLMYNLMRRLPDLFDSGIQKKKPSSE